MNISLPADLVKFEQHGAMIDHASAFELARVYSEMVKTVRESWEAIERSMKAANAVFLPTSSDFSAEIEAGRNNHGLNKVLESMKKKAWRMLADRLGIESIMSIKAREALDRQIETGEGLPEITEETIIGVIGGMVGSAAQFAKDAAMEVFDYLRPSPKFTGLKTNNVFRIGKRVILTYATEIAWNGQGFRPVYGKEGHFRAIDNVFHVLDQKPTSKMKNGDLAEAILKSGACGKGETEYFRFKCHKNGRLHLEFKRLDLVKEINRLGTGQAVLGHDD